MGEDKTVFVVATAQRGVICVCPNEKVALKNIEKHADKNKGKEYNYFMEEVDFEE